MWRRTFKTGDYVVYRKPKNTTHPGPRAKAISPASNGDLYSYVVDKYWRVCEVLEDGRLRVRTASGKMHLIDQDDIHLRRGICGIEFSTPIGLPSSVKSTVIV